MRSLLTHSLTFSFSLIALYLSLSASPSRSISTSPSLYGCLSLISPSHRLSLSSLILFDPFSPSLFALLGSGEPKLQLAQGPVKEDSRPLKSPQPKPQHLGCCRDSRTGWPVNSGRQLPVKFLKPAVHFFGRSTCRMNLLFATLNIAYGLFNFIAIDQDPF